MIRLRSLLGDQVQQDARTLLQKQPIDARQSITQPNRRQKLQSAGLIVLTRDVALQYQTFVAVCSATNGAVSNPRIS
jgi:biopolymer transport protein ExbD